MKPGTRCECRDLHSVHFSTARPNTPPFAKCPNNAVRMVTARHLMGLALEHPGQPWALQVPMCEPCARFHEAKASAKAKA